MINSKEELDDQIDIYVSKLVPKLIRSIYSDLGVSYSIDDEHHRAINTLKWGILSDIRQHIGSAEDHLKKMEEFGFNIETITAEAKLSALKLLADDIIEPLETLLEETERFFNTFRESVKSQAAVTESESAKRSRERRKRRAELDAEVEESLAKRILSERGEDDRT